MKKFGIWIFIFTILSAYSWQLLTFYQQEAVAEAFAKTHHEARASAFERIIDRLSLRKAVEDRECQEGGRRSFVHCKKASIFGRLIFFFSAHVS